MILKKFSNLGHKFTEINLTPHGSVTVLILVLNLSQHERNIARSMLVGAPVMVAQMGAQKLRNRMLEGDSQVLQNLQLDTPTTLGQVKSSEKCLLWIY